MPRDQWTATEDAYIKASRHLPAKRIAQMLCRSTHAIYTRRCTLANPEHRRALKKKVMQRFHARIEAATQGQTLRSGRWTDTEIAELCRLDAAGLSQAEIGLAIGRSFHSVAHKREMLLYGELRKRARQIRYRNRHGFFVPVQDRLAYKRARYKPEVRRELYEAAQRADKEFEQLQLAFQVQAKLNNLP